MQKIRVIGTDAKGKSQRVLRVFNGNEAEKAFAFMREWLRYGEKGDIVRAWGYENGRAVLCLKGYKKV